LRVNGWGRGGGGEQDERYGEVLHRVLLVS